MTNILQVNAETFTRTGQIIETKNAETNKSRHYLLVHKATSGKDTGFLCVRARELSKEQASRERQSGNQDKIFSINTVAGQNASDGFKSAAHGRAVVRHFQIDTSSPVILLDSRKQQDLKITDAIQPPGSLEEIMQKISNGVLTKGTNQTVRAYRNVFTPEAEPVKGLTSDYRKFVGDYRTDIIRGKVKTHMRHAGANRNLARHGTAHDDPAPNAE